MRWIVLLLLACAAGCAKAKSEDNQQKESSSILQPSQNNVELQKIIEVQNRQIQLLSQRISMLEQGQQSLLDEQRRQDKQLLLRMSLQDLKQWRQIDKTLQQIQHCSRNPKTKPTIQELLSTANGRPDVAINHVKSNKEKLLMIMYIGIPLSENELDFYMQYFDVANDLYVDSPQAIKAVEYAKEYERTGVIHRPGSLPEGPVFFKPPKFNQDTMPSLNNLLNEREQQRNQHQSSTNTTRP